MVFLKLLKKSNNKRIINYTNEPKALYQYAGYDRIYQIGYLDRQMKVKNLDILKKKEYTQKRGEYLVGLGT